jgi:hypothetical protein
LQLHILRLDFFQFVEVTRLYLFVFTANALYFLFHILKSTRLRNTNRSRKTDLEFFLAEFLLFLHVSQVILKLVERVPKLFGSLFASTDFGVLQLSHNEANGTIEKRTHYVLSLQSS